MKVTEAFTDEMGANAGKDDKPGSTVSAPTKQSDIDTIKSIQAELDGVEIKYKIREFICCL